MDSENPNSIASTSREITNTGYSQIIDNLYISSAKSVTDELLTKLSITHIVNATRTIPLKRNYQTLRVNVSYIKIYLFSFKNYFFRFLIQ